MPEIIIYARTAQDRHDIESALRDMPLTLPPCYIDTPERLSKKLTEHLRVKLVIIAVGSEHLPGIPFIVRSRAHTTAVLVLSHETEIEKIVAGLLSGASDYLPWDNIAQLPARILQFFPRPDALAATPSSAGETKLKSLIKTYPIPGWITDDHGNFIYFNDAWLAYTSTDATAQLGQGWHVHLLAEDIKRFQHKLGIAIQQRHPFSIDIRLRRYDGVYRWVYAQGIPHQDGQGRFGGYIGSCAEINAPHNNETMLVYRAITQAALAGFGRLALTRQPFPQLTQEATRLICDTLQLKQSEVLLAEGDELRRAAATGPFAFASNARMSAPPACVLDNQTLLLEDDRTIFPGRENHASLGVQTAVASPINGGRTLLGFLTGLSDRPQELGREATDFIQAVANILSTVHQREQAEAALEESERKLLQSQKMEAVGLLAGGVAHDFNNLLTAVRCYGEMLNEDLAEVAPDLQPKVSEILKASARASALTRQLLTFSRKQVLQPEILDLNAVVTDLKDLVRSLLSENVTLHIDLMSGQTACEVDRNQLDQIILNLCLNARDAMANGGQLNLRVGNREVDAANPHGLSPGQYLDLQISDTGTGMSPAVQANIFQPFFTTKALGHGTGLGLATCAVIAKNFHGAITFTSELGRGTCFSVLIPLSGSNDTAVSTVEEGPPGGGNEHILLVEDDDSVRHVATLILANLGYKVTVFPGSMETIEYFKANENLVPMFDLLLSDVVMPFMNGRNLAKEISARQPGIKVLFMSGYVGDADILADMQDSDLPFLEKPFTRSTLARKVRETLA